MRGQAKLRKIEDMVAALKNVGDNIVYFDAVIYLDEDEKLAHAYDPEGKVISAPQKKIKKKLRKAFGLKKKTNIYLVISQFHSREQVRNIDNPDYDKKHRKEYMYREIQQAVEGTSYEDGIEEVFKMIK